MKNIEKSLQNSIQGTGSKIPVETICAYAQEQGDDFINILFKILSDTVDNYTGKENLDYLQEIFDYINIAINNSQELNRKNIRKKIAKLEQRVDRTLQEKSHNFFNKTKSYKDLGKIKTLLDELEITSTTTENKQYDFMSCLIEEAKDLTYIEYTLKKLPSLVNVKDKNGNTLYKNLITKFINSVEENNIENILYYNSLIALVQQQKLFELDDKEKKEYLEEIYKYIDWLSYRKKENKNNREKLRWLENLKEIICLKDNNKNIEQIASKYNIPVSFEERLIEEVNMHQTPISKINYPDRGIVKDYIITIDGYDAVEIDDALSCKKLANGNFLLGVHIASVLGYFPYNSTPVEEAINRVHSIYLPKKYQDKEEDYNKTIPIFPYSFSAKRASLLVGEPKLARSYYFEIDKEGNVINESFHKTIIISNKKTTYAEINNILEHGTSDEQLQETVTNLKEITTLLDKKYKPLDLYEKVKESSPDFSELRVKRIGAEKIVYQAMLLTGNRVAEFFANPKREYPCLYRVHTVDSITNNRIEDMINTLTSTYGGEQYEKLYHLVNGIYPKGWYDLKGAHNGLALEHYCHCTSGLRRAPDIVVEHALETCYDKTPSDKDLIKLEEEIRKRAIQINGKTKPIDWFVEDYARTFAKRRK